MKVRMLSQFTGFGVVAVAAVLGTTACGGSSRSHVASLATSTSSGGPTTTGGGRSGTTTRPIDGGNPTRLLDEWAACMRRHGDPGQVDPSIDTNKVIHIPWNPAIPRGYNGTNKGGQGNQGPGQYCRNFLQAAGSALRGGPLPQRPSQAQLVKYSECMRANGIPDFPDPTGRGLQLNMGGDLSPQNPTLHRASRICTAKTGAHVPFSGGTPPPGTITLDPG